MALSDTQFIKPEMILKQIGLSSGMQAADLGAGSGYFVLPLARLVGARGKIFAVDVQKSALEQTRREARAQNLANIETIWSDIEVVGATKILPHSLDVVLVINTLFQTNNKANVISEARRLVKPGGLLLVVDWKEGDTAFGPLAAGRLSVPAIREMAETSGFVWEKEIKAGPHHFGLLFRA